MFNAGKGGALGNAAMSLASEPRQVAPSLPVAAGAVVHLSRPIATHKGDVAEIRLKQPTFADFIELGDIDTVVAIGVDDATGQPLGLEVKTNHKALERWAVRLTGHDAVVLNLLAPSDAGALMREVRMALKPFSQGNSQTGPTT
jgi:hypothetical protein